MSTVTPFPYQNLPHMTSEDVALRKKMLHLYTFFSSHKDIINHLTSLLKDILKTEISLHVTHLALEDLEHLKSSLSQNVLAGLVSLEPQSQKGALIFDVMLAKIMVQKLLSSFKDNDQQFLNLAVKPLTPLEEALVQYVLVSMVESLNKDLNIRRLKLSFDSIHRDATMLSRSLTDTKYAVFSVQVHVFGRDFYLKFLLPAQIEEGLSVDHYSDDILNYRLKQFGLFNLDLFLEVAQVTLEPSEISALTAGDILLFDSSEVTLDGKTVKGQAHIKFASTEEAEGYLVDVQSTENLLQAKIISVL